jgi:hypothetical protein
MGEGNKGIARRVNGAAGVPERLEAATEDAWQTKGGETAQKTDRTRVHLVGEGQDKADRIQSGADRRLT